MKNINRKIIVVVIIAAMFVQAFGIFNVSMGESSVEWDMTSRNVNNGVITEIWMKNFYSNFNENEVLSEIKNYHKENYPDILNASYTIKKTILYRYTYLLKDETNSTEWTTKSFKEATLSTVYLSATNVTTETKYRAEVEVTYKANDNSNDTMLIQPSSQERAQIVVSPNMSNGTNQTETIDNSPYVNKVIKFINQLYQMDNADYNTLAVKAMVVNKKTAGEVAQMALMELLANGNLSKEEFNREAYKRALGREPNADDEAFMKSHNEGSIIDRIISSKEFTEYTREIGVTYGPSVPTPPTDYSITPEILKAAQEFWKKEYIIILDRELSEEEIKGLDGHKYTGMSIVNAIFNSAEFKNKKLDDGEYMQKLAKAINLGRDLTEEELAEYKERLASGESRNVLLKEMMLKSEFRKLCNSYDVTVGTYTPSKVTPTTELAKEFTINVYTAILGENVERVEAIAEVLAKGKKTPAEFIRMFVNSSNFQDRIKKENLSDRDYVKAIFKAVFQREPSNEELSTYLNKLDKNNKSLVMVDMVNSKEFVGICNKYYLPYSKFNTHYLNGQQSTTETANYNGASIEKKTLIKEDGTLEEIITAVHFNTIFRIKGDVDGDGKVSASDAAIVLISSAVQGASGTMLADDEVAMADVNGDEVVNASDAALILIYSAKLGANGTADWKDIINAE